MFSLFTAHVSVQLWHLVVAMFASAVFGAAACLVAVGILYIAAQATAVQERIIEDIEDIEETSGKA